MIVCNLKPKDFFLVAFLWQFKTSWRGGGMSAIKIIFILVWWSNEHRPTQYRKCLRVDKQEQIDCIVAEQAAWHLFCMIEIPKVLENQIFPKLEVFTCVGIVCHHWMGPFRKSYCGFEKTTLRAQNFVRRLKYYFSSRTHLSMKIKFLL